jgi:hypothetical protein
MVRLRLKPDQGVVIMKDETRLIICPESWRATDELVELWGVIIIKEHYRQPVESRGIDPGHKVLEVSVDPFKPKLGESGEDRASWVKRTSAFLVRRRLRGPEMKVKFFEAGQHGETSDHHPERGIP